MNDELQAEYAEAKTFAWAAPVILPLIEKRKRVAFELLVSEFKQGKTDPTARIAELTVLSDLEREIHQKQNYYEALEAQHARK